MEKIQAAIAKARATRQQPLQHPAASAAPSPAVGPVVSPKLVDTADTALPAAAEAAAAVDALWAALPGFVPKAAQLSRAHVVTFAGGAQAVAFDGLRTKLLQQMRANNWRRLAITSPGAGCGKSMLAMNLAFGLARQPDLRTLLIELDLRRPSLEKSLGINAPHTFARVLEGKAAFEDHVLRFGANLAIATNQSPTRHPAELLSSPTTATVLAEIEARYAPDVVIFDMPPMMVTDDTMAFAAQVDCALIVAAAEASTVKEIDICERELASQTNVVGVVLNKCRYLDRGYGYGYYN